MRASSPGRLALLGLLLLVCGAGLLSRLRPRVPERRSAPRITAPPSAPVLRERLPKLLREPSPGEARDPPPAPVPSVEDACTLEDSIIVSIASGEVGETRWRFGLQAGGSTLLFSDYGLICLTKTGTGTASVVTVTSEEDDPSQDFVLDACGSFTLVAAGMPVLLESEPPCEVRVGRLGVGAVSWMAPVRTRPHPEHLELSFARSRSHEEGATSALLDVLEEHAESVSLLTHLGYLEEGPDQQSWERVDALLGERSDPAPP